MRSAAPSRRCGVRRALPALFVLVAHLSAAWGSAPEETTKLDCGVNALFVLLKLEGCPVTFDQVEKALPATRSPDGYSMAELAAASKKLGVSLDGVKFTIGDKPLARPAIAFLQDGKAGHFAVLRPVGTTRTMVQVIDPPSAPWIADYPRLLASKPWTGRILTPRDNARTWATIARATAGVALLALAVVLRRRSRLAVFLELPVQRPLADA